MGLLCENRARVGWSREGGGRFQGLWAAVLVLAGVAASPAWAEPPPEPAPSREPEAAIAIVEGEPEIDGVLDDAFWRQAAPLGELTQVEPVEGAPPTEPTDIRIASNGRAIYFGIRCYDAEPDKIIAQKLQRDESVQTDDRISIVIDTFHDKRNGFFFQINPNSARRDGLVEAGVLNTNFDLIWRARARIDEQGWTLEIEIPYQSLSFAQNGTVWGLNVLRSIRRRNELLRWAAVDQNVSFINMGRAGTLVGLQGLSQGLGVELSPFLSGRVVDDPIADREYTRLEPGGEVFYRPIPAITTTLTVNTDFAATEVDARQVNLTRFALFFPEQREFFLQDAGIFEFADDATNGRPFFSRRVGLAPDGDEVPIRVGGKATGRVGRLNFGLLDAYTSDFTVDTDDGPARIDHQNLFVGRLTWNVFEESKIGTIVTNGDPATNEDNTLLGFDFNYRDSLFLGNRVLEGKAWYQRSWTEAFDDDQNAWGFLLRYPNDRYNWSLSARTLESSFRPALGFVNRTGIRQYDASLRQRVRPGNLLRTVDARVAGLLITDTDQDLESGRLTVAPFEIETILDDRLDVRYERTFERLDEPFAIRDGITIPTGDYGNNRGVVALEASQSRAIGGRFEVSFGGFFSGTRLAILPRIDLRPSRHLLVALEYEQNEIDLDEGDFSTRIARVRLEIAFNADVSWNTFVQWDDVTDSIGINSRFRWIIQDGREVVVVYNQGVQELDGEWLRGRTEAIAKVVWTFRF